MPLQAYFLVSKRAVAYEDATVEWVDCYLGSKLTMKYPSIYLLGERAHGEVLSIAFAGSPPTKRSYAAGAVRPKRSARPATTSSSPNTTSSATRSRSEISDPTGNANATHPSTAPVAYNASSKSSATRSLRNHARRPNRPPERNQNRVSVSVGVTAGAKRPCPDVGRNSGIHRSATRPPPGGAGHARS